MLFDAQSDMALRSRARLALKFGNLEEAYRILLDLTSFKKTKDGQIFSRELSEAFKKRAGEHAECQNFPESLLDINRSIELGGANPKAVRLQKEIQSKLNWNPEGDTGQSKGMTLEASSKKYFIWIDGVGTYLVLPCARITLGRFGSSKSPDISLAGGMPGIAAEIIRTSEQYILTANCPAKVNGKTVHEKVLANGDLIQIGDGNEIHFYIPCPMNSTAILRISPPSLIPGKVTEVVLLEQFLIAGRKGFSHIKTGSGPEQLILYPKEGNMWVKIKKPFSSNIEPDPSNTADGKRGNQFQLPLGKRLVFDKLGITVTEG